MENEIMNNVVEEVMENNEDIIEVCSCDGTGKGIAIGVGLTAVGYGLYRLGKKVYHDIKAKKSAKINIPEDISDDKIDEIPE